LPGPSSTQLAIYCAWRLAGWRGALLGGAGFILPGLVVIVALSAVFLADSPPSWIRGAGAGAGAAVAAVALQAGRELIGPSWERARHGRRARWLVYVGAGAVSAALLGPWVVLVLLAAGAAEVGVRALRAIDASVLGAAASAGGFGALAWTSLKVGALSYGGGFVIIPLMQADAVDRQHWMSAAQFLNAVALGQVTPGPVVHTVAVVGYAAGGVVWALAAAVFAFAPSFAFILVGASRFERLRANRKVRAFLDGAGPAAIGAILGSAIPLADALSETWQYVVLACAATLLLSRKLGVVATLAAAGLAGIVVALAGGPLPA
jgi:chromate transporter